MVSISSVEFRLLLAFLEHPRQVLDRDRLLDLVEGREAHLFDRAVDNQVSRLRRKIEADSRNPTLIQTVWGGATCSPPKSAACGPGTEIMRLWPRSLQGQLLLAVAVALLLGQAINATLLYRAQAERREAALMSTVAFRLYGALRDDDEAVPRRFRRPPPEAMAQAFPGTREPSAPAILPSDQRLHEQEQTLRAILVNQGVALAAVQILRRDIAADPVAQRRLERRMRRAGGERLPDSVIVAAVRRDANGPWAVARVLVPPRRAGPCWACCCRRW